MRTCSYKKNHGMASDPFLLGGKKVKIIRLDHATTHHPPPAKIYPPPLATTYQQPKYIHHQPKNGRPPAKVNVYPYITFF